jgi:hypothetical protein
LPGRRDVRKILGKKNAKEEEVLNLRLEREHTEERGETVRYRGNPLRRGKPVPSSRSPVSGTRAPRTWHQGTPMSGAAL